MGDLPGSARTHVPCIGRWILNHCSTREALYPHFLLTRKLAKDFKWAKRFLAILSLSGGPAQGPLSSPIHALSLLCSSVTEAEVEGWCWPGMPGTEIPVRWRCNWLLSRRSGRCCTFQHSSLPIMSLLWNSPWTGFNISLVFPLINELNKSLDMCVFCICMRVKLLPFQKLSFSYSMAEQIITETFKEQLERNITVNFITI